MRNSVWIFLLAVLLPSIVLGWLALRSAEEQKIILERRTAELYQRETESVAAAARAVVDEQRRVFAGIVRDLLAEAAPAKVATEFAAKLRAAWPREAVGFAIDGTGRLVSPSTRDASAKVEYQRFLWENGAFLGGTAAAMVYPVAVDDLSLPEVIRKKGGATVLEKERYYSQAQKKLAPPAAPMPAKPAAAAKALAPAPSRELKLDAKPEPAAAPAEMLHPRSASTMEGLEQRIPLEQLARNVQPQQQLDVSNTAPLSQLAWQTTEFRVLCEQATEGMITRFVQDRLDMIFWLRPAQAPELVFGCLIEAGSLRDLWPDAMPQLYATAPSSSRPDFILALLDEKARPVVTAPVDAGVRDWKRPFVASEIGEALPHWEAALYLARPEQLGESARTGAYIAYVLIYAMVAIILVSAWLLIRDTRRQLALAQKKTDFVSNVSHELKTPLTSIRMFAEMMQGGTADRSKYPQYLRIIMVEAERLTRLINNVLDFAKLERKQKHLDKRPLDLHAVIARTWESHALHLQESGFTCRWQAAPPPYPVLGDDDALAQILVNLLANAEKYAGERKEVELHSYLDDGYVCVSVLDRGSGVPPGEERKIFEAFYRAHDSLASGIQGSGLGLTLAQRLAREHGGEVRYEARSGGGSSFTLRLPLRQEGELMVES